MRTIANTGTQAHPFEAFVQGSDTCKVCGYDRRHHVKRDMDPTVVEQTLDYVWGAAGSLRRAYERLQVGGPTASVLKDAVREAEDAVDTVRKLVEATKKA